MTATTSPGTDVEPGVEIRSYPISPDYCHDWTVQRALCELIANALDEVQRPDVRYARGRIVVEDDGPGMPRKALVLGVSHNNRTGRRKGAESIGTFGEGAKIAALVLSRNGVPMRLETVGYGFEPRIAYDDTLETDVLHLHMFPTARTKGTRIEVQCDKRTADAATGRFLRLNRDYTPPSKPGRMIADGEKGRVYLGGVFVQQRGDLRFSYDVALTDETKRMQNRDRTILDGRVLDGAVSSIVAQTTDREALVQWVRAALAGELHRCEAIHRPAPQVKLRVRDAARDVIDLDKATWVESGNEELAMDLRDKGFDVIVQTQDIWQHRALMDLLGIDESRPKLERVHDDYQRERSKAKVHWARELTEQRQRVLDEAVRVCRASWPDDVPAEIKVFERAVNAAGDEDPALGFYFPRDRSVAVRASQLDRGLLATVNTITHELAHRRAHRTGGEFADRTRGFESALHSLAAEAALRLAEREDDTNREGGELIGLDDARRNASVALPRITARELLRARLTAHGFPTIKAFAKHAGLSAAQASKLLNAPGTISPAHVQAACDKLDLPWAPVYLALQSDDVASDARNKDGRMRGARRRDVHAACESLRELGGPWADPAAEAQAHADGTDQSLPFAWQDVPFEQRRYGYKPTTTDFMRGWAKVPVDPAEPFLQPYRRIVELLEQHVETADLEAGRAAA